MADTKKKTTRKTTSTNSKKKAAGTARKKTTTKRNTASTKGRKNAKPRAKAKETYIPDENDLMIRREVLLFLLLGLSVLIFLSNLDLCGRVGKWISYFFFGTFGIYAYIMPVLIFFGAIFAMSNKGSYKAKVKMIAVAILLLILCGIMQLVVDPAKATLDAYYHDCAVHKSGGGILGGILVTGLTRTIGEVGAYVILIICAIADLVVITGRSVMRPVKNTGSRIVRNAKDHAQRRREEAELYEEGQEDEREFQNAGTGRRQVHLKNTKLTRGEHNDIHEIQVGQDAESEKKVEKPIIDESIFSKFAEEETEDIRPQKAGMQESVKPQSYEFVDLKAQEQKKEEEDHIGEDGLFTPKEQIHVSKEAKETMARKPFSTASSEVRVHTEEETNIPQTGIDRRVRAAGQVKLEDLPLQPLDIKAGGREYREYKMPPLDLLKKGERKGNSRAKQAELKQTAIKLQQTLQNFGVGVTITDVSCGPSVTRYELQPEMGTKVSKITGLQDDIKLNLAASDIRIEAPIPGKAAVGIEVPNTKRETVYFRDLIESEELRKHRSKLAFAAGKDISGKVVVADIAKMPHMLIAGTTGSGKSVFTNSIIMSILYRARPDEVKLIIVDPKVVEFGVYNGIPHLLIPVVTDPRKAAGALNWAVAEMQERYKKFAMLHVRDLEGYNKKVVSMPENASLQKMPQILIIIDELADLMMAAAKEVEEAICRLAQLARAAGIHLVIATQRPSVDVVTGLIKANIPSRVALLVSSGTDSRTIIDMNGAEKLLGNGDMLFYPSGYTKPVRVQGAFISDTEVTNVVSFIKQNAGEVQYDDEISGEMDKALTGQSDSEDDRDMYFEDAARFVVEKQKASTSMLQRIFKIGFNRAARIMDQLQAAGVVGSEEGTKPRRVLMDEQELEQVLNKNQAQ